MKILNLNVNINKYRSTSHPVFLNIQHSSIRTYNTQTNKTQRIDINREELTFKNCKIAMLLNCSGKVHEMITLTIFIQYTRKSHSVFPN